MNARIIQLPVTPLAEPVQLVLGLNIGIRTRRRRKRKAMTSPPVAVAA